MVNPVFVQISAGGTHSLAVDALGRVWAWGQNLYGELGNGASGSGVYESRPVLVDDATPDGGLFGGVLVESVSAGSQHSLTVDVSGRVWTWGNNNYGQVGDGTSGSNANKSRPVNVQLEAPTVSVAVAGSGLCVGGYVASLSGGALDGGYSAVATVTYTWRDVAAGLDDPPLQSGLSNVYMPTVADVGKTITVTVTASAWNWQDLNTTSAPVTVPTVVSGTVSVDGSGVVGVPVSVKKTGTDIVLGAMDTTAGGGFSFGCAVWNVGGVDVVFTNSNAPVGVWCWHRVACLILVMLRWW
jgi:hypothetical protein